MRFESAYANALALDGDGALLSPSDRQDCACDEALTAATAHGTSGVRVALFEIG
jgi:hypothetical protein